MVYMKGQVENSKCVWESMQVDWLFEKESVRKLWRMVRYPWGEEKIYSIRKDLVEQNKDM